MIILLTYHIKMYEFKIPEIYVLFINPGGRE